MVSNMEVAKVADMELDMVASIEVDKVALKKSTSISKWKSNLVSELVSGAGKLGPNFFDSKFTWLPHLLSFASLSYTSKSLG